MCFLCAESLGITTTYFVRLTSLYSMTEPGPLCSASRLDILDVEWHDTAGLAGNHMLN